VARDLRSDEAPRSVTLIAFAVGGMAVGAAIVYLGGWAWNDAAKDFAALPEFRMWAFLVGVQVASWFVGGVFVYRILRDLWSQRKGWMAEIVGSTALIVVPMLLFVIASRQNGAFFPLPQRFERLNVLTAIAFVVAIGAAIGMWLIHAALARRFGPDSPERSDDVREFAGLVERLQLLLTIQGAILAGAILGAGALRNAVDAAGFKSPPIYVLLYGVFLTGLVALAYAPTYARARTLGRDLRERCLPPPPAAGSAGWSSWLSERKALDELLGIHAGTAASLRTGLVILAPLSASLIGLLLGGK
jgi:hypothetical protein